MCDDKSLRTNNSESEQQNMYKKIIIEFTF